MIAIALWLFACAYRLTRDRLTCVIISTGIGSLWYLYLLVSTNAFTRVITAFTVQLCGLLISIYALSKTPSQKTRIAPLIVQLFSYLDFIAFVLPSAWILLNTGSFLQGLAKIDASTLSNDELLISLDSG
jgi:hypothetical protein